MEEANQENRQLTKHERRLLKHQQKEHLKDEQRKESLKTNKIRNLKKFGIYGGIFIIIIALISFIVVSSSKKPGQYDNFAKCLTEKGAIMYGAIEWCEYTKEQANMFGKSFKYVNYKDYKEGSDISITPTWIIDGQKYERVQSFQKLSELTGCTF